MPKQKVFNFILWTKDVLDVDIVAKNKKDAEQKLQAMYDRDEIRWDKSWTADSGTKYLGMTRKEI